MKFAELSNLIKNGAKSNSNVIFAAVAGVGTVATAVLTARATFKASKIIRLHEANNGPTDWKQRTKLVWKCYIPPALSTATAVGCIVAGNRVEAKRLLAANAALDASQRAFDAYKDKVVEEFGKRKDQSIRDKVAEEQVKENPPCERDVILAGEGRVLCCELFTMRYFMCDMEKLRRSVNSLNERLLRHDFATLDDFYYLIGLKQTSYSGHVGWTSDKLMDLTYTAVLTDDERPCIAFEYNYTKTL